MRDAANAWPGRLRPALILVVTLALVAAIGLVGIVAAHVWRRLCARA